MNENKEGTLEDALARVSNYVRMRDAKPMLGMDDVVHGIHTGTQWQASIRLSDLRSLVNELAEARDCIRLISEDKADLANRLSKESRWIPVSERMPEPRTTVLAFESSGNPAEPICVALYNPAAPSRHMLATDWVDSVGDYIDVSHWMPLPEAPK